MIRQYLRLSLLALPMAFVGSADRFPFQVGEHFVYDTKVNSINAGKANLSIEKLETVRGVGTMHAIFDVRGRVLFKKFASHTESWFDTTNLATMRLITKSDDLDKTYEFYPAKKMYIKNGDGIENPSVEQPIDEASFLFYLRTVPLEVGKTLTVDRYYHALKNPITIHVDRREHVKVPAGEFDAYVLKPVIKSNGLFSVKSEAEVWIADDRAHTVVKMRSKLPLGTLYLELRSVEQPD
jgi:hypothetical protein